MDLKVDELVRFNKMALFFEITFRWHKDRAYEAMNDNHLDELAHDLIVEKAYKTISCADIREIYEMLQDRNEYLSTQTLREFMKGKFEDHNRYIKYIQDILEYGFYAGQYISHNPARTQQFVDGIKIVQDDKYGFTASFTIPEESIPDNCTREMYLEEFKLFKDSLADGLWEGCPGSTAVHESGAVVTFTCR